VVLRAEAGKQRLDGPGFTMLARSRWLDDVNFEAELDGTLHRAVVLVGADSVEVRIGARVHRFARRAVAADARGLASDARVTAPMPGRVLALDVAVGDSVAIGDRLLVLEAMKMEHRLSAKLAGTIAAVHIAAGDQVADGMLLVEIEGTPA